MLHMDARNGYAYLRFDRKMRGMKKILWAGFVLSPLCGPINARAGDVAEFFHDKTITVTVGYSPGGAYDAVARLLATYMPGHMSGHPTMLVKNVPGAGSLILANQIYNLQTRDGTTFFSSHNSVIWNT